MRLRRVLLLGVLTGLLVPFGTGVRPAHADDCQQLVKGIGDLGDPAKVQDCLRTGSNWGRTIGTVVAATGAVIAGAGLIRPNRPPRRIPRPTQEGLQSKDPCVRAVAHVKRIQQLEADRLRLEQNILREFRTISAEANSYANAFRMLKEAEYKTYLCVQLARTFNVALVGSLVLTVGGTLAQVGAAGSVWWSGAAPAAAAVTGDAAAAAAAKVALQQAAMKAGTVVLGIGSTVLKETLPANVPGPKTLTDPWASGIRQKMYAELGRVASAYLASAREFNQKAAQWGANRQQDLEDSRQKIQEAIANWRSDADQCPGAPDPWGGQAPSPDFVMLQVPQARTEWGTGWFVGGWLY